MSLIARDLPLGPGPFQTQPPEYEWPFLVNRDSTSFIVTRFYKQRIDDYNADRLAGRYLPGVYQDPDNPGAYLVEESKANRTTTAMVVFTRTFARVPTDQVWGGTRVITKPLSSVATFGGSVFDRDGAFLLSYYIYGARYWGNNEVFGPTVAASSVNSGADTRVTCTAHGATDVNNILVIVSGTVRLITTAQYAVIDPDTIDILGVNYGTTVSAFYNYARAYTPGTARVGTRETQHFYLPGVTPGIATFVDIPLPNLLLNDAAFLTAVISTISGFLTYDGNELTRWLNSPIYTQTLTEINMANV